MRERLRRLRRLPALAVGLVLLSAALLAVELEERWARARRLEPGRW